MMAMSYWSGEIESHPDKQREIVEKYIRGELSDEEVDRLRGYTPPAQWELWGKQRDSYKKMQDEKARVAAEKAEVEALIAECSRPLANTDGPILMAHRTNRLLAAILRKLSERGQ